MTILLVANKAEGVYQTCIPLPSRLRDMEFYDALSSMTEEDVYGEVSVEIAQLIQNEYGINL